MVLLIYSQHLTIQDQILIYLNYYYLASDSFLQPAMVPLATESHGGDDVAIFALGPQAHLFQGGLRTTLHRSRHGLCSLYWSRFHFL